MTVFPHVFGTLTGEISLSDLDENFDVCAFASDLAALTATVTALPATEVPLSPVAGGSVGTAADLARSDHRHPPQGVDPKIISTTSYTVLQADYGVPLQFTNAAGCTVTIPNNLTADFNTVSFQYGAVQVSFAAASGALQRQRSGFSKTAGLYGVVSILGIGNSGGSAFEYILSGDMA